MVDHIEHDTEKNVTWSGNKHMDDAARILHEAGGHREYSAEDRRRVLRRIDLFVCVPMCITYFIQQVCHGFVNLFQGIKPDLFMIFHLVAESRLTCSSTNRPFHTPLSLIYEKQPISLDYNTHGSPRSSMSLNSASSRSHPTLSSSYPSSTGSCSISSLGLSLLSPPPPLTISRVSLSVDSCSAPSKQLSFPHSYVNLRE